MTKRELVELFTTSETLLTTLRADLETGTITGRENPTHELSKPMYHFSDVPLNLLMARLKRMNSELSPSDSYEVRSLASRNPGKYIALRRDGVLAIGQDEIKRMLSTQGYRPSK